MRTIIGFLLGASAVALVTTERGRRFAADIADELETAAKGIVRDIAASEAPKPEPEKEERHA